MIRRFLDEVLTNSLLLEEWAKDSGKCDKAKIPKEKKEDTKPSGN
ncbi:MAG: hypothetical protein ACJAT3_000006 [Akkermansiaceae bacterium]